MDKKCKKCGQPKNLTEFNKAPTNKDGYQKTCKKCLYEINKLRYFNTKEYKNKNSKRNFIRYKNDISYRKHQNLNSKKFKDAHPDYDKNWRIKNREKINKNQRERKIYNKIAARKYRKNNPIVKIKESIRSRINCFLRNKSKSSITYLGCDIKFYKEYLESKFTPEMNWDNYGRNKYWEIDHIIPCSKFDLTKEEELYKAFHYTNTQPLTITLNRQKYNNE